jgi:uncharacterized damage-inducible protein DinB
MIYHTIAEIMEANRQAEGRLIEAISNLNETQANFRPDPSRWTIAEIAEHIGIVNGGFLRLMRKFLGEAEASPKAPSSDLNLRNTLINEKGEQFEPFEAPERVRPKGGVGIVDSISSIRATSKEMVELQPRIEAVDLSEQTFSHPVFGPLNAYQWLLLLGEHENRHRGQIERLKADAGYPG